MDDVHLKPRLTAVLLADVVGYSRLMSADEEGTHLRLTDYVQNLIDPAVAKHRGRLIRSMGDGMLVEFDRAPSTCQVGLVGYRRLAVGIGVYCQPTLQISAQIWNFWVLEALRSAAVT